MADSKPASAMPLPDAMAGNFQEAARWFNQLWAGVGQASTAGGGGPIPSVLLPTLDVKELDKRIADLRSVEHWLQLNQGLLHSTIQGLEMQRNTLSAWQSFGAAATGPAPDNVGASTAPEQLAFQPALWWAALQEQFAQMATSATAGTAPAQSQSAEAKPASSASEEPLAAKPEAAVGGRNSGRRPAPPRS